MPFLSNSSLFAKFYPRNINYMPAVKFKKCLDLRRNVYSRISSWGRDFFYAVRGLL